ncbi:MAG: TetR/AcrR family transcriptional regulator [Chloroflexota bacterium]
MATRRERDTERTREQIMEAASELFLTDGYEAVSVRKIAEKANISHGTIYIHFKDKDDLLYQVSEEQFSRLMSRLRRLPRSREPLRRIEDALLEIMRFGLDHPNDFQLMMGLQTTYGGPKSINQWGPNAAQVGDFLDVLMQEAAEEGQIQLGEKELDDLVILSVIHGVVITAVTESLERERADDVALRSVEVMLRGLGAGE